MSLRSGYKIIAAAILLSSFTAQAQDMQTRTPQERAQKQTQMMQKKLSLTADQAKAISAINMSEANMIDSLQHSGADKKMIGRARKQGMANKDAQYQSILTADQYKQYQVMEEQRKQRMMERRKIMQNDGGQSSGMDNTGND